MERLGLWRAPGASAQPQPAGPIRPGGDESRFQPVTPVWAPDDFVEGETLFIVARYTFNPTTTTDDQVDLWINPDPASFGAVHRRRRQP